MEAGGIIRRKSWVALVLLAFALYFVTRLTALRSVPVFIDEAIYIHWARKAVGGNPWASLLWDGKPPLHPWAMAPFLDLSGDPLLAARLSSVFFGSAAMAGTMLVGREMGGRRLGIAAGFLYAACPYCLWYDRVALTEGLLLALSVFAVYFTVRAATSGRHRYLLGTAVATGLALLTKGSASLLYPVVALGYLCRSPGGAGSGAGAAGPGVGPGHRGRALDLGKWSLSVLACLLLAFGIQNLLRLSPAYGSRSTFVATRTKGVLEALAGSPREMLEFDIAMAGSLLEFMTPALALLGVLGFLLALKRGWRPGLFLAAWFLAQYVIISLVAKFAWPRFYLVLVPPLLLSAGYCLLELADGLRRLLARERGARALAASAAVSVLLGAALLGVCAKSRGMIEARDGDEPFLSGRTCGAGLKECVRYLEAEARRGTVTVVVNDYFLRLAIEMYSSGSPRLQVVSLDGEFRAGPSRRLREALERAVARGNAYLMANNVSEMPDDWPVRVLRVFHKDRGGRKTSLVLARAVGGGGAGAKRAGPPP